MAPPHGVPRAFTPPGPDPPAEGARAGLAPHSLAPEAPPIARLKAPLRLGGQRSSVSADALPTQMASARTSAIVAAVPRPAPATLDGVSHSSFTIRVRPAVKMSAGPPLFRVLPGPTGFPIPILTQASDACDGRSVAGPALTR